MFAFQTLGVMADAAEAIATDADVSTVTLIPKWNVHETYSVYLGGGFADSNGECCG